MRELTQRDRYQPSGRVGWIRFFVWAALALVASVALGVGLHLANVNGFYIIVLAPLVAGAAAAGMVFLAVRQGHCRNRWVGGLFGIVAGAVVYLGYYHAGLVGLIGVQDAHRLDLLPKYIQLRLKNDVVEDVGKPANQQGGKADVFGNGFLFLIELGLICAFTTAAGIHRANIPYSEVSGRWMLEQRGIYPSGFGNTLVIALETNTLAQWVAARPDPIGPIMPNSQINIHYDPALSVIDPEGPVFLTVRETTVEQQGRLIKKSVPKVKTLLNHVRLTPEEVATLIPVFAALKALLPDLPAAPAPAGTTTAVARVEPVPSHYAGRLLARHYYVSLFLLALLIGSIVGGIGLILAGLTLGILGVEIGPLPPSVGALASIVLGIACLALLLKLTIFLQRQSGRTLYRAALREIPMRPDPIVDAEDPAAIFVAVVPRKNWARSNRMLETASDAGFLRIDTARGLILFEGDYERYWVPVGAILGCEVEQVEPPNNFTVQSEHYPHFMAVLRAQTRDGPWEAPMAVRHDPQKSFQGKSHQAKAYELQERILELLPRSPESA